MARSIRAIRARQNPFWWTCRWFAGTPLNGAARTNASFLHAATKNESGYFWTKPWHRCEQWKVSLVRSAIAIWLCAVLFYWFRDFMREDGNYQRTYSTMLFIGAILVAPFAIYWAPRLYDLRHYRTILSPIARAIGPVMGMEKTPPNGYIDINRKFVKRADNSAADIRISHALAGQPGNMRNIEIAIRHCLAANEHELRIAWLYAGTKPRCHLTWAPAPPKIVTLAMAQPILDTLSDSKLFIGMARAHEPSIVDIDTESPHLMLSVGTGGGKSVLSRGFASQLLHNGAAVYIMDVKRISHRWAKSVSRVHYAREIEEIHNMLIELRRELDRRNAVVDGGNSPGQRIVFIIEEMNMLMGRLKSYWAKIRERNDPKTSPAIEALGDLLFAGREVKMHAILIAQYLTAKTAGGTEARENLGFRIFGRYSPQSWKNLAGDIPMPPPSRHPGRIQIVMEGVSTEVQAIYMTDEEAIHWAMWEKELETIPATIPPSAMNGKESIPKNSRSNWWDDAEEAEGVDAEKLKKLLRLTNPETSSDISTE